MSNKYYLHWLALSKKNKEILSHLATTELLQNSFPYPKTNSHKGDNGKVLIIGGSPLFHGAGHLAAKATQKVIDFFSTIIGFSSRTNDMVYFCSTKENIDLIKPRHDTFIGITREQIDVYLPKCDAVLVGPGLMREADIGRSDTERESLYTKKITKKVLSSNKKAVLDAGSLQVISSKDLQGKENVIITPHRIEMKNLFELDDDKYFFIPQQADFEIVKRIAQRVLAIAQKFGITILLKGPIDIIVSKKGWFFSPGGSKAMTKGGTGDVLGGVVTALYSRIDNPLVAATCGSFILKRAGEDLEQKKTQFFDAADLSNHITETLVKYI